MEQNENQIIPSQQEAPAEYAIELISIYEGRELKCWLRTPDKSMKTTILSTMYSQGEKANPFLQGEKLLRTCWICGDLEFLEVDDITISASIQCFNMIRPAIVELKKN